MVVVYRFGAMTAWILRRLNLVKVKFFAQQIYLRIGASSRVFSGGDCPGVDRAELLMWLEDGERRSGLEREFSRIHAELRRDAGTRAAQAIVALLI